MADGASSFFTRQTYRFVVPHPPLGERWILVVHAAVKTAFVLIRNRGFNLKDAGENAITNELEGVLRNDLLKRGIFDGLDPDFFRDVTRGSEVENYKGDKISKKPDLLFHLQRENVLWDRRQDAIFAECKPVDAAHSLAANYCAVGTGRTGLERFVIGDYAWAMQEAMMIAYVRDGFRIDRHLMTSLSDSARFKSLGSPTVPIAVALPESGSVALHRTEHRRLFVWKENGRTATPIILYHSWHDCT